MRKDWVIWLWSICLFAAGAIWGMVPIGTDFFAVQDIHDLAEIIGAIATVIAVGLAAAGINAWRTQTVATSDHELARRAAIALQQHKFASMRAWEFTDYLVTNLQHEIGKGGVPSRFLDEVKGELKELEVVKSKVHSVALECRALWGEKIWQDFERAFWLANQCHECISLYLRWSRIDEVEKSRAAYSNIARQIFKEVTFAVGKSTETVSVYIESVLSPLESEVNKRLLR